MAVKNTNRGEFREKENNKSDTNKSRKNNGEQKHCNRCGRHLIECDLKVFPVTVKFCKKRGKASQYAKLCR